jgi:hypothetical protein
VSLDAPELDLMPAVETTGGEPQLTTSCCSNCYSSLMLVTNGCEW